MICLVVHTSLRLPVLLLIRLRYAWAGEQESEGEVRRAGFIHAYMVGRANKRRFEMGRGEQMVGFGLKRIEEERNLSYNDITFCSLGFTYEGVQNVLRYLDLNSEVYYQCIGYIIIKKVNNQIIIIFKCKLNVIFL